MPWLLVALGLVVDDILPLRLALVGVDEAAKLIHLLTLRMRVLKATLLCHGC